MENEHIVKKFDQNLGKIKAGILEMGDLVARQVKDATAVLFAFDADEAARIVALDRQVNGLNKELHSRAEILIARRQPMALDLRQTLAPIHIANELERVGDHAKSTAKRARIINNDPPADAPMELIARMSVATQTMLADVLTAYATADIELAARVRAQDQEVDALNNQLVQTVIQTVSQTPENAECLIHMALISRNFERIGDHVTNIARFVHQITTGDDLKASN